MASIIHFFSSGKILKRVFNPSGGLSSAAISAKWQSWGTCPGFPEIRPRYHKNAKSPDHRRDDQGFSKN